MKQPFINPFTLIINSRVCGGPNGPSSKSILLKISDWPQLVFIEVN